MAAAAETNARGAARARSDKIFINYRRQDTAGFAGRLSDSLAEYFGRDRVFRDVTDIDYGDDFEQAIERRLEESGAIVVVIGERWSTLTDDQGQRRLDDPEDLVTREISVALERGIPVVPVLIGDTCMPRKQELPERLHKLARHNALTVSDERWEYDVERLAKVLAIDVSGSVAQRRLDRFQGALMLLLFATMAFGGVTFCRAVYRAEHLGLGLIEAGFTPILSAVAFLPTIAAGTLSISMAPSLRADKRWFAWLAVGVCAVGCLGSFLFYTLYNNDDRAQCLIVNFACATLTAAAMSVLLAMTGFRPK